MKLNIILLFVLFALTKSLYFNLCAQVPPDIDDLQVWLRGDSCRLDNNGMVDSLYDLSGNDFHFYQSNVSRSPQIIENSTLNNRKGIYFDGNDFLTGITSISDINSSSLTIYIVAEGGILSDALDGTIFTFNTHYSQGFMILQSKANQSFDIISKGSRKGTDSGSLPISGFEPKILSYQKNYNVESLFLINDSIRGSTNVNQHIGNFNNGIPYMGSRGGTQRWFRGSIYEIIIFDRLLNENENESILNYLKNRYVPELNLGQDIIATDFCGREIACSDNFSGFLWSTGDTSNVVTVDQSGTYWVSATDIFGFKHFDSINVEFPEILYPSSTQICPDEEIIWDTGLDSSFDFFWSSNFGNDGFVSIINDGSYYVTIQDSIGCNSHSDTLNFTFDEFYTHVNLGPDTSICSGNSISFDGFGYLQSESFSWSTTDTTQSIVIENTGSFSIEATNSNGCIGRDTIEVTIIGDAPDLSYSIPFEVCQGSELNFTENSTVPPGNTISQVVWDFGDLDSSFNNNGSHIYVDSGSFTASLQVSTLEGCSSRDEFTIIVHPKPIISFTTEKYCPYEEIEFSASNEYDIPLFFYNWEFGQNASSSTDIFPSYSYGTSGNYDVQLIAIDTNNCIDTVIQNVFIQPAPVAEISVSDPCELAPLEIIDNCSIADTFSIVTYTWNYGDNTSAINPNEDKIYESYGQYNVQLALEADNGCVDTVEQLITVYPKPVLAYDVGPACKNTWTSLDNVSTIPEGSLTETNWLINLQYNLNQQNTAFKFPTLGIQLVNLESISDQGCLTDTTFDIDVQDEISADYTLNPMNLTSGTPIQFINESLGADSSFWDFGDGNGFQYNQNQINEITYDQSLNGSSIDVALIITNDIGCRDTSSYTYEIKEAFLDLALQTLFVQDINGYLTVGVELSNLGSFMIENADLYLKSAENGSILENWTGQLAQNESEIYIFNAHPPSYSSIQDDTERYICVEGGVSNSVYLDVDLSNNIICKNIEGNGLVVLPIYPNPTEDDITVSILLTESAPLHIELVDQSGRLIIIQDYTENLNSGIHKIVLPFSSLQKGIYHLRVSDSSTTLIEKIVRN